MSHAGVTKEFTIVLLLVTMQLKLMGFKLITKKTRNIKIETLHQDWQDYDVYYNNVDATRLINMPHLYGDARQLTKGKRDTLKKVA